MILSDKFDSANTVAFPLELSPADQTIARIKADLAVYVFTSRSEESLTQKQFADKYGISQSTVSKIENGDDSVSLKAIIEVAASLGLELRLEKQIEKTVVKNSNVIQFSSYRGRRCAASEVSKSQKFFAKSYQPSETYREEM